jgi:predicted RNA-binding Zn-ribbon protein involved in translation (DUF1610 family)
MSVAQFTGWRQPAPTADRQVSAAHRLIMDTPRISGRMETSPVMNADADYCTFDCPDCGAPLLESALVEVRGSVGVFKCPRCGSLIPGTGVPVDQEVFPTFVVRILLPERSLLPKELLAIRSLVPDYSQLSLAEVRQRVRAAAHAIQIDNLGEAGAEDILRRAHEQGLVATMSPSDTDSR